MNTFSISSLQKAIQEIRVQPENPAIRQIYCDHLSWVHSQVFEKTSPLFSQDFYWLSLHYPERVKLGQDPKLAQRVLKAEQVFQSNVLEKNTADGFSVFMKHYTEFAGQISKKARDRQDALPFRFVLDNPQLISWYQKVLYKLLQNEAFHQSFLDSDPETFSLLLQRGISELIESDVKTNPMPVLLTEADWKNVLQIRDEYFQKPLQESSNENVSLSDQLKRLGAQAFATEYSKRQSVTKLMHALTLLIGEE